MRDPRPRGWGSRALRRPVRFFVHDIRFDDTIWLDDGDGEESSVVSVTRFDSMGHHLDSDMKLRVIVMQLGRVQEPVARAHSRVTGGAVNAGSYSGRPASRSRDSRNSRSQPDSNTAGSGSGRAGW